MKARRRKLLGLAALALMLTFSVRPVRAAAAQPGRVALLCWEGAGASVVRRMLAAGAMPHLAGLVSQGAAVDFARPPYARGRAAATAAFWTGAGADANGVSGDFVPALPEGAHSIVEGHPALVAEQLGMESLCVSAARAGKRVVAVDWPWGEPAAAYREGGTWGAGLDGRLAQMTADDAGDLDRLYASGGYGRALVDGGDGTAETRYVDALVDALAVQRRAVARAMREGAWDLFVLDLARPSRVEARWLGYVTTGSPAYDPALAAVLEPHLRRVFAAVDDTIGAMRGATDPQGALVVASDRALVPARWDFLPNVVLRKAGLLKLDAAGRVDVAHTRAMFDATGGGYVVVNDHEHLGGVVQPETAPGVVATARTALAVLRVKTPEGIVPVVTDMVEPGERDADALGLGGLRGGDLYLMVQRGYGLSTRADASSPFVARPANESATEPADPRNDESAGVFFAGGIGVAHHARLAEASTLDVVPTVEQLLHVKPARGVRGRALVELLARK